MYHEMFTMSPQKFKMYCTEQNKQKLEKDSRNIELKERYAEEYISKRERYRQMYDEYFANITDTSLTLKEKVSLVRPDYKLLPDNIYTYDRPLSYLSK